MTRVITFANRKGGSGKTTLTVHMAAEFSRRNKKVLALDLDPQCHTTFISGINPYERQKGLGSVLRNGAPLKEVVRRSKNNYFDVAPLYHTESNLEFDVPFSLKTDDFREFFKQYDYVMIDTPPSREDLQHFALSISTGVLIPLQLRFLAMEGFAQLIRMIYKVNEETNPALSLLGVVPMMYDMRSKHEKAILNEIKIALGENLIRPGIRTDIKIAESSWLQQPIQVFNSKSKSVPDFEKLADSIAGIN